LKETVIADKGYERFLSENAEKELDSLP